MPEISKRYRNKILKTILPIQTKNYMWCCIHFMNLSLAILQSSSGVEDETVSKRLLPMLVPGAHGVWCWVFKKGSYLTFA